MADPITILAEGARLNRAFTRNAVGVAVVFAVLAIAKSFFGDDWMTAVYGSALVFVGVILVLAISRLGRIPGLETTVVWFIRAVLSGLIVFLFSALTYVVAGFPATFPCTVRFDAAGCSRLVANPSAPDPVAPAPPPPAAAATVLRDRYTVYVQFAGFQRPTIVEGTKALRDAGWRVPGEERIGTAAGLREIRYRSAEEKSAADLLAADLNKTKLPAVKVRQVSIIAPATLELWISQ